MTTVNTCPVCGNNYFVPHLHCRDHTISKEVFHLIKCTICNLIITSPRPESEKLGDYYKSEFYISHTNKAKNILDRIYLLARRYTLNWKLRLVSNHSNPGTILDYGCGTGEFLRTCKNAGWKIAGIEPSPQARLKAERLNNEVINSSVKDLRPLECDAISLWHVLEHVPDLNYVLQNLLTKPKVFFRFFSLFFF